MHQKEKEKKKENQDKMNQTKPNKQKYTKQASPTCLHTALGKARPASLLAQLYELKQGD